MGYLFWIIYAAAAAYVVVRVVKESAWEWDYWIGHTDHGPVVMVIKKVTRIPFTGWQVHLHKMVLNDMPNCFHTHPAHAIRIVLWGGYVEEIYNPDLEDFVYQRQGSKLLREWRPLQVGHVAPPFAHRIDHLRGKTSWSLWLRGPIISDIELVGPGWKNRSKLPQV